MYSSYYLATIAIVYTMSNAMHSSVILGTNYACSYVSNVAKIFETESCGYSLCK